MVADVILISGPAGAGKSTAAHALAAATRPRAVHLHSDDLWRFIVSRSITPYRAESDAQNHTVMVAVRQAAWAYAQGSFTTVVDGVIRPWMLHHFTDAAPDASGAEPDLSPRLHYVVLRPARDETLRRAQQRTSPDTLTDADPVLSMWDQFAELGHLERYVIDTSANTPQQRLAVVRDAVASGAYLLPG